MFHFYALSWGIKNEYKRIFHWECLWIRLKTTSGYPALSKDWGVGEMVHGAAHLGELFTAVISGCIGHWTAMELRASWWLPFVCGTATALSNPTSQYTLSSGLWQPENRPMCCRLKPWSDSEGLTPKICGFLMLWFSHEIITYEHTNKQKHLKIFIRSYNCFAFCNQVNTQSLFLNELNELFYIFLNETFSIVLNELRFNESKSGPVSRKSSLCFISHSCAAHSQCSFVCSL